MLVLGKKSAAAKIIFITLTAAGDILRSMKLQQNNYVSKTIM